MPSPEASAMKCNERSPKSTFVAPIACSVVVLGEPTSVQRVVADANDYRLIAIPFHKFQPNNTFKSVSVTIDPGDDMVTKHEVLLADPDPNVDDPTESADIGFLVQRTAMRP